MDSNTKKTKKNISFPNPVVNDNANDNFTPTSKGILFHLQTTNALSDLCKLTAKNKSNIHRTLKNLRLKGFVENRHGLYYLTASGHEALNPGRCHSLDGVWKMTTPSRIFGEKIRLHDVSFTLRFWVVPDGWNCRRSTVFGLTFPLEHPHYPSDLGSVVTSFKSNDAFRGGGLQTLRIDEFMVVCYASSVRVFVPEVVDVDPVHAMSLVWKSLISFIPKLERLLGIPTQCLWSEGRLNIKISSSHYALFRSAFAAFLVKDKGETRFVVPDSAGVPRLLVDRSLGGFELEAIDPLNNLSDIEIIREFNRQLIEGEGPLPKETKDSLDLIGASLSDVSRTLTDVSVIVGEFSVNVSAHTGTAKANLVAAESLNRALDRLDRVLNFFPRLFRRFIFFVRYEIWKKM